MPADILNRIVEEKWREVGARSKVRPLAELDAQVRDAGEVRGFMRAIRAGIDRREATVIAELKKASPSKGVIRESFDAGAIAASYAAAGATCLSVLTDMPFFGGSDENLTRARDASALPVLRKDFIVDPWQVYESRVIGADCILLIAGILSATQMKTLYDAARSLDLDVLVEVHDADELEKALQISPPLIGINNRDLNTFEVDLNTTFALAPRVPADMPVITESGIHSRADVEAMLDQGIYGFLVGEAFMVEEDPGAKLHELFFC